MCGILGLVEQKEFDLEQFRGALNSLAHRGPDDFGTEFWADHKVGLGHRRLSIIDLSRAGRNPMPNEDHTVWIIFNGEIYNYRELRQHLESCGHRFQSNTDTEVIIHAYEEWGDAHVQRLRGMFAYAIYDRRKVADKQNSDSQGEFRLLLVRDRLGIKPLFYYWHHKILVFASEIKAILACPGINRTVDHSALFDYLTYRYIPAPKTAYQFIRKLEAGHYLVFDGGLLSPQHYWDISSQESNQIIDFREAVQIVRETLTEAVALHMSSDVPLGVFLSGGLDSSAITAFMSHATSDVVRTFSIGFDVAEHSELDYARAIAHHYQTEHQERIVTSEGVEPALVRILKLYDEPFADSSAIPTYQVSALARERVKVALAGDGGDEIFAGYNWYTTWLQLRCLDAIPLGKQLFSFLGSIWPEKQRGKQYIQSLAQPEFEQYCNLMEIFTPEQKRKTIVQEWANEFKDYDDYWYFRKYWREDLDPLRRLQYLDLKTFLPELILTKVDRASMAVALEVRPPMLDHLLVELLFSLPTRLVAPDGQKKYLLKEIVRDLLPAGHVERPKKGFSSPLKQWLNSNRAWVEQKLDYDTGFLNKKYTSQPRLMKRGNKVWSLLVLTEWLRSEIGSMENR